MSDTDIIIDNDMPAVDTPKRGRKARGNGGNEAPRQIGETVVIKAPEFRTAAIEIVGIAPLVMHKFSAKAQNTIIETQKEGSRSRKGKARVAKDFDEVYEGAKHVSQEGWYGIPCAAFRNACISACRLSGFKMTIAKMTLFVEPDGFEADGTPLVKITKGEPKPHFAPARNANGSTDVRCRPMFMPGWRAVVRVRWDGDQFSSSDIANLMARVGLQVGVLEGRPDSRMSAGQGWGMFQIAR